MIQYIKINKFRIFNNISFKLGKHITAIAGQNATGKSTILGLLGNCGEIKQTYGHPILKKVFRTEFSEIFKASKKFDLSASNIAELGFCNNDDWDSTISKLTYRITWQENGTRFRIIPNRKLPNGKISSSKICWPTLYLGLARLYPIGETNTEMELCNINLSASEKDWFIENYTDILSLNSTNIKNIEKIQTTEKKTYPSIGINTDSYDSVTNSAGQDNLGQILLSVLSFQRQKEKMQNSWEGGLLLIDEIDATLHPIAQNKLVDFLYKYSKLLNIQIVFTTHSLSLLEYISSKTSHNPNDRCNNYQLIYLTTSNDMLQVLENPSNERIRNDLLMPKLQLDTYNKITIYTEDEEARFFIKRLLADYLPKLNIPDVKIGCMELLSLIEKDFFRFQRVIFIFDGDVEENKITYNNCIKLPGQNSPEKVLWDFLNNDMTTEDWNNLSYLQIGKREFVTNGPATYTSLQDERSRYKAWFKDNIAYIEPIFRLWKDKNKLEIDEFINKFIQIYNKQADKHGLSLIKNNSGQI